MLCRWPPNLFGLWSSPDSSWFWRRWRRPSAAARPAGGRTHEHVGGLQQLLGSGRVDVLVLHAVTRQELWSDLVRSALAHDRDLGIVLVTETAASDFVRDALEIGIRGWVCSDESLERLVTAVREVGAHEVFIRCPG